MSFQCFEVFSLFLTSSEAKTRTWPQLWQTVGHILAAKTKLLPNPGSNVSPMEAPGP